MPINFKKFTIPFRKPIERKTTEDSIKQRQTREIINEQIEQVQVELEDSRDFEIIQKTQQIQLNLQFQEEGITKNVEAEEKQAAIEENIKRAKFNQVATQGVAAGAQIAVQVARNNISTIGIRTGNVIRQERLERSLAIGSQAVGIGIGFAVNPLLGTQAAIAFTANQAIREYTRVLDLQRTTKDNALKMELVGGIAERGNR